jgi:hypothetical protein
MLLKSECISPRSLGLPERLQNLGEMPWVEAGRLHEPDK